MFDLLTYRYKRLKLRRDIQRKTKAPFRTWENAKKQDAPKEELDAL